MRINKRKQKNAKKSWATWPLERLSSSLRTTIVAIDQRGSICYFTQWVFEFKIRSEKK